MALTEERAIIRIVGDNTSADKALKETANQLQNLQRITRGPIDAIAGLSGLLNFSLPLAASAAATGMVAMVKSTIDYADQLNKLSQRTGLTVEQLSAMKMALDLSDVTLEQFSVAISKFNNFLQENKKYSGNVYDELLKVADQFKNMKDSSQKAALAMQYFGRSGTDLIPLLNLGSEGLKEITEKAKEFGIVISTETAVKAELFNDRLTIMKSRLEGIGSTISQYVLNAFDRLAFAIEKAPGKLYGQTILGGPLGFLDVIRDLNFEYQKHIQNLLNEKRSRESLNETLSETIKNQKEEEQRLKRLIEERKRHREAIEKEYEALNQGIIDNIKILIIGSKSINDYSKELTKLLIEYQKWLDKFGEAKAKDLYDNKVIEITLKYREEIEADHRPVEEDPSEKYKKELKAFTDYQTDKLLIAESIDRAITDIEERELQRRREALEAMQGHIEGALEIFGQTNRTAFELYKAYKITETLISTYSAAVKAYESLIGTPLVGPIIAPIAAGAAIAYGLAQVSRISSMQPGSTGGGYARPSTPNYNISPSYSGKSNEGGGKQIVTINIYGSVVDHDKFAREIIPSINKAIKDGVR